MHVEQIEVLMHDQLVGRMIQNRKGLCAFEYSSSWLQNGFSISPFELPLRNGPFVAKYQPFQGGFGVFDDCLPDGWGLLILHRYLQQKSIDIGRLTLLDRLALVGSTGRGALEFRPDRSVTTQDNWVHLERLAIESENILAERDLSGSSIEEFQRRGGSPGGARPKITVKIDGNHWLVKFRAHTDALEIGQIEYQTSLLARECGVEMPETRLFEGKYFGVRRFDRTAAGKVHVVSMAGLVGADYRVPSIDYSHLFQVCAQLTRSMHEIEKLYRLMVFNVLIDNKDDHAKNFAFIYQGGAWRLSPAFDLLPSDGINGFRTTSINDSITPTSDDLFAVAERFGLSRKKAQSIHACMRERVQEHALL